MLLIRLFINSPWFQYLSRVYLFSLYMHGALWFYRSTLMTSFVSEIWENSMYTIFLCLKTWPLHVEKNAATARRKKYRLLMRDPSFYYHLHFKSNQGNEPDQNLEVSTECRQIHCNVFLSTVLVIYTKNTKKLLFQFWIETLILYRNFTRNNKENIKCIRRK